MRRLYREFCRTAAAVAFQGIAAAVLLLGAGAARAQGYEMTAGASSLTGVDGVTLSKFAGERTSLMSVGATNMGVVFGAATEVHRADGTLRYGDTTMGFTLPTDLDSAGRSVGARGAQWTHATNDQSFRIFAGKTGNPLQFGYLNSVDVEHWAASVEWVKSLSPKMALSSIAAVGAAHAALSSLVYKYSPQKEFAATAGWNAGHGIVAFSAKMRGPTWTLRMSETLGRLDLRPETNIPLTQLIYENPEREGLNYSLEKRLRRWLEVDTERVAYAKDPYGGLPDGAQMYENGITSNEGALTQGVRWLSSQDGSESSEGLIALARYKANHWTLDAALMEDWLNVQGGQNNGRSQTFTVAVTHDIGNHYKLTGGADFNGGNPTFLAGGEVDEPFGSVGVSETVVYVPFGLMAGFTRVTEISIRMHPHGVVQGSVDMLMGKNVPWSYTAVAETFLEHESGDGGEKARFRATSMSVPQYVLRGVVVDQFGAPVESAAVRVGDQTVYTNEQGVWEYRQRKPIPVSLHVAPEDFVTLKKYVSSDPDERVTPATDRDAKPIVMHVFYQPPSKVAVVQTAGNEQKPQDINDDFADAGAKPHQNVLGRIEDFLLRGAVQ